MDDFDASLRPPLEPVSRVPVLHVTRPALTMRWELLTYLHWPVAPDVVAGRLPVGLSPDIHDGVAWVGLVPFRMARIDLAGRVTLPQGTFPETNVRTYVVGPDGGRGVYFHSLDVPYLAPTAVARTTYRLPYCWSRMRLGERGDRRGYLAVRRWPGPSGTRSRVIVGVGERLQDDEVTPLDDFLSARWSLYDATPSGRILRAHVEHARWPLRQAEVQVLEDGFVAAAGYDLAGQPPVHVRAADPVEVRVDRPRIVG